PEGRDARPGGERALRFDASARLDLEVRSRCPGHERLSSLRLVVVAVVGARQEGEDRVLALGHDPVVLRRGAAVARRADREERTIPEGRREARLVEALLARNRVRPFGKELRRRAAPGLEGGSERGRGPVDAVVPEADDLPESRFLAEPGRQ